jgi:hypothetical protein
MPHVPVPPPDPARERDAVIIAHVVALIHSRSKGDYLTAAQAHHELERLGVLVRFPRQRKGVDRE